MSDIQGSDYRLDQLCNSQNAITELLVILREEGKEDEASMVQSGLDTLEIVICRAQSQEVLSWTAAAKACCDEISRGNGELNSCLGGIRSNIDTAKKITNAIGIVSQIVARARSIFPG